VANGAPRHVRRADEVDPERVGPCLLPLRVGHFVDLVCHEDTGVVDKDVSDAKSAFAASRLAPQWTATASPSCANAWQIAAPIPRDPPVTRMRGRRAT
jgi:hypothetical protein